jgi:peroxiredoxin
MRKFAYRLTVATLGAGLLIGLAHAELENSPAPDFVLKAASGKNHRLSEYRGQVVLLSFWASWCGECRTQLRSLSGIQDRYAGAELQLLSVSLDRDRTQVADAAGALGMNFPALHDEGGNVGEQYDVDNLPYVLLIDQEGVVRQEFTGYRRGQETEYLDHIRSLLAE